MLFLIKFNSTRYLLHDSLCSFSFVISQEEIVDEIDEFIDVHK